MPSSNDSTNTGTQQMNHIKTTANPKTKETQGITRKCDLKSKSKRRARKRRIGLRKNL